MKNPVTIAPEALDFTRLIGAGETIGWAEATAEPVFLTRLLLMPANISAVSGLVSSGRLPIDLVLLQVSGPDETGRYNAGLGIEHLHATIGRARLVIAQVNPELPWTHGDTAIEPGLIDVLVPAAVPPMELPARPAAPIDRAIADPVARLWLRSLLLIWSLTAAGGAAADHDKEGRPGGGGRRHPAIDVRLTQSLGPEAPLSTLERSLSGTHAVFRAARANRRLGAHPVDHRHLS